MKEILRQKAVEWSNANNMSTTAVPVVYATEITGSDDSWKEKRLTSLDDSIGSFRDKYPELFGPTTLEMKFQELQNEEFQTFVIKNKNYGMHNISGGEDIDMTESTNIKESLQGLYFRMRDKLARFKQLIEHDSNGTVDESLSDTLMDIGNYAKIANLVRQGKWVN